jgi:prolyl 4-hydroxylase
MTDEAFELLEQKARAGDINAQIALGKRCEIQGNNIRARGCFASAAKAGNIAGARQLAINLLVRDPVNPDDGMKFIVSAASAGDAEAAYICAMLAAQDGNLDDRWYAAGNWLRQSAERGWALAQQTLTFLEPDLDNLHAIANPHSSRTVIESPRILVFEEFASPAICDWLVARTGPHLSRAQVYSVSGAGREDRARTNSSFAFDIVHSDLVLMLLRARIAASVGVDLCRFEATAALHYKPGQEFEPHCDFLDATLASHTRDIAASGQRAITFLLYLNDDFEGGETAFTQLDWRFKGRKGDAIAFWNLDSDGAPNPKTEHAGLPPTTGEKWLLSQWIRQGPSA